MAEDRDGRFDWLTLFYDVYRVGEHAVLQGPPLHNFAAYLKEDAALRGKFGLFGSARIIERRKGSEIWLKSKAEKFRLESRLGTFEIAVQPNLGDEFAGKRVVHTLSKDNDIRWIADWIRFYVRVHGADAALLYDNASTRYDVHELRTRLREAHPGIAIRVVSWPFIYGPQAGPAHTVNGVVPDWDSDFCQTGSLQHARHRFLSSARSVLNADIDELVMSSQGRSIFEVTERARDRFVKFEGVWISTASPSPVRPAESSHGDFFYRDKHDAERCTAKWCLVPGAMDRKTHHWSIHNVFGSRANAVVFDEFLFRHFKGVSNNWKDQRSCAVAFDPDRFEKDEALAQALSGAGMSPEVVRRRAAA